MSDSQQVKQCAAAPLPSGSEMPIKPIIWLWPSTCHGPPPQHAPTRRQTRHHKSVKPLRQRAISFLGSIASFNPPTDLYAEGCEAAVDVGEHGRAGQPVLDLERRRVRATDLVDLNRGTQTTGVSAPRHAGIGGGRVVRFRPALASLWSAVHGVGPPDGLVASPMHGTRLGISCGSRTMVMMPGEGYMAHEEEIV
jgi:hypothetical protein